MLAVEDGRGDHADGVEHDLGQEEPQEQGAELALGVADGLVVARRERPHDPGRGDGGQRRHGGQQRGQAPQHGAGDTLRLGPTVAVEHLDQRRHEDGLERAGGDQLEEQVRHRVGGLVGVAQGTPAEHGRHHQHPGEARDPRDEREDADGGRRSPQPATGERQGVVGDHAGHGRSVTCRFLPCRSSGAGRRRRRRRRSGRRCRPRGRAAPSPPRPGPRTTPRRRPC